MLLLLLVLALLLRLLLLQSCQVLLLAALTLGDTVKQLFSALAQVGCLPFHITPPGKRARAIVSDLGTRAQ